MKSIASRMLVVLLLAGAVVAAACESDSGVNSGQAQDRARDTTGTVRDQARDAWASLRTDGERLIDNIQTRNDPEAKQQLLDRCRDAEERLRENDSRNADRVNEFCDNVRDTDLNNTDAWERIKAEFEQLRDQIQS
jgi:hypothetical protein